MDGTERNLNAFEAELCTRKLVTQLAVYLAGVSTIISLPTSYVGHLRFYIGVRWPPLFWKAKYKQVR